MVPFSMDEITVLGTRQGLPCSDVTLCQSYKPYLLNKTYDVFNLRSTIAHFPFPFLFVIFTIRETEVQRGVATCPWSQSRTQIMSHT